MFCNPEPKINRFNFSFWRKLENCADWVVVLSLYNFKIQRLSVASRRKDFCLFSIITLLFFHSISFYNLNLAWTDELTMEEQNRHKQGLMEIFKFFTYSLKYNSPSFLLDRWGETALPRYSTSYFDSRIKNSGENIFQTEQEKLDLNWLIYHKIILGSFTNRLK